MHMYEEVIKRVSKHIRLIIQRPQAEQNPWDEINTHEGEFLYLCRTRREARKSESEGAKA